MASKTITALKTDNNNLITTNGSRDITGAILNGFIEDILDSCVNRISDVSILGLFDFSSSQTYLTGQAVIYNDGGGDQIYRANKDNGPAAFNPLDWDAISGTFTLTDGSGTTANGTAVDWGGTISASANISGFYNVSINTTGGGNDFFMNSHGLRVANTATLLKNSASTVQFELIHSGLVKVYNSAGGNGLQFNDRTVDEASLVWATDLNNIPSIDQISSHIGLQDVNALVTNPTVTEDGYAIVWDNTAGEYQLQSAGTAISGTDNYIPIFNATGDNIEDSSLQITGTATDVIIQGLGDNINTKINFETGTNTDTRTYYQTTLEAKGSMVFLSDDGQFASITNDTAHFQLPTAGVKSGLWSIQSNADGGSKTTYNSTLGLVDYMGHKYGANQTDPRFNNVGDSYSWISTNDQKLQVGYAAGITSNNAHLIINSDSATTNPRPHVLFTGGYNEAGTAPSNNSMWLSSNGQSYLYWKDNGGVSIPMRGLKSVISNSQASTATLTPNADSEDIEIVTALTGALTIAAPTGTPVEGQRLVIKIKDNGTSRALTWNAIFQVIGTTLPTATTISKWHRIECEYNVTDTKWDVIDVKEQA